MTEAKAAAGGAPSASPSTLATDPDPSGVGLSRTVEGSLLRRARGLSTVMQSEVTAWSRERPSSRGARNIKNRSEDVSAQWASSTVRRTGPARPSFTVSEYSPHSAANGRPLDGDAHPSSKPSAGRAAAAAASSRSSRSEESASKGAKSWRTTPNENSRSSSVALAESTRIPARPPPSLSCCTRRVLPVPAGPSINTVAPIPDLASPPSASSCASSRSRSSNAGSHPGTDLVLLTIRVDFRVSPP